MTIAQRNNVIKLATGIATILAIFAIISGIIILNKGINYTGDYELVDLQPNFISKLPFCNYSNTINIIQAIFLPLVSLGILLLILFLFEKTQAIEISYFAMFALAISFEALRLIILLLSLWLTSPHTLLVISKAIYFFRLYALLALLVSGLFAAQPFSRRTNSIIFIMVFIAFSITFATPYNSTILLYNFILQSGFSTANKIMMGVFALFTVCAYFVHGKSSGINEYVEASKGMALIMLGYALFTITSNLPFFIIATTALILGIYIYLKNIHLYHLWQ